MGVLKNAFPYDFSYKMTIISDSRVSSISLPPGAEVANKNSENNNITIRSTKKSRVVDLLYRTADMMVPHLTYAKSVDGTDEMIAVSASLVATFDEV